MRDGWREVDGGVGEGGTKRVNMVTAKGEKTKGPRQVMIDIWYQNTSADVTQR